LYEKDNENPNLKKLTKQLSSNLAMSDIYDIENNSKVTYQLVSKRLELDMSKEQLLSIWAYLKRN